MTYACPTWEFSADTHLMKLQRLQNRVLRAIGKLYRRTPVRYSVHVRLHNQTMQRQREVILNHENPNVRAIVQGETRHMKHKRLELGGGQVYDRSSV
jgi:hypothetical protein